MYEEKKFGWRAYKYRLLIVGLVWIVAFIMQDRWGPPDMSSAWIMAIVVSLLAWGLGAWESELRYQTPSHIVAENGLHFSFHPFAVHNTGKWSMIAVGGISAGGIEFKGGEGTLVCPTALLQKSGTNPPKILYIKGAPCKCSIDALPEKVRNYIPDFGELKPPFYFTQTPIVDTSSDDDFKKAVIKLAGEEEEVKNLNKQVTERDKIIRDLLTLREELKDFRRPWYKKFLPSGEKKEED